MSKLDSNFGAPFHVIVRDQSGSTGVVSSFPSRGDADDAASSKRAELDATGNEKTDVYVVDGQPGLAAFIEEHDGIPVAVQTDNSGAREAEQAAALVAADPAPAPKSSSKSSK